ncbi:MAG: hypothetical protein LQ352_004272 [Teloschistes flavicans]|nr:MAG: hypothetical protein LQ352_004272 [Teloschistes flavicans]
MLTPLFNASPSRLAIWLALTFFGYSLVRVIHRIFFHPLARVPGPKLAAATLLYQTYYSFAGSRSRFYIQIAKLHQAYGKWFCPGAADPVPLVLGPIVRISPDEVHLSDAENYDKIYHVGSKYSKDGKFYGGFSNPNSMFTTPSNELHRTRRAVLNNFFSRKSVLDLEDVVQEKVQILMEHVSKALASGTALDVHHGLRAVSIDVITDYAFGQSYGLLDQPDLGLEFSTLVHRLGPAAWVFRQWPWLSPIVMAIPKSVIYFINKPMGFVRELQIVTFIWNWLKVIC